MSTSRTLAIVAACALIAVGPALAQEQPGGVRIQGRDIETAPLAPITPSEALVDTREQMRRFVQTISAYARKQRPNFVVLVHGGLELVVKRDDTDETRISPARTYARSIDGVLQEGIFYGERPFGQPPTPERQALLLQLSEEAKRQGLKVLSMDFAVGPAKVDDAYRQNRSLGVVPLVVSKYMADLDSFPDYPNSPINENANSVISIDGVRNYALIANSQAYGRMDEFALKMHDSNYDMLIVDVFHGRRPLSRRAVETLKFKKIGARRLVLAYVDIGSAASYRYYWRGNWREGSPLWISAPYRDDPDKYYVQYWMPAWQRIISGDPQSYIYGVIAQGFDGVVLGGLDAYRFFEGGTGEEGEQGQ